MIEFKNPISDEDIIDYEKDSNDFKKCINVICKLLYTVCLDF